MISKFKDKGRCFFLKGFIGKKFNFVVMLEKKKNAKTSTAYPFFF